MLCGQVITACTVVRYGKRYNFVLLRSAPLYGNSGDRSRTVPLKGVRKMCFDSTPASLPAALFLVTSTIPLPACGDCCKLVSDNRVLRPEAGHKSE
jgi:hypothetical protein